MEAEAVNDLIAWLRACLDREEQVALAAAERYVIRNPDREDDGQPYWPLPTIEARFRRETDPGILAGFELIKMNDPASRLADVAAKRAILELREDYARDDDPDYEHQQFIATSIGAFETVIGLLAQRYAGWPGWREEWTTQT